MGLKSLVDRVRVGLYLTRLSINTHGTGSFWRCVSWWHEETHVTIPRIEEERRMAAELERMFEDKKTLFGISYDTNSSGYASISLSDGKLVLLHPAGQWTWNNIVVNSESKPNLLRRVAIKVLLGAEWTDYKDKETEPMPPEYVRWEDFVSEVEG